MTNIQVEVAKDISLLYRIPVRLRDRLWYLNLAAKRMIYYGRSSQDAMAWRLKNHSLSKETGIRLSEDTKFFFEEIKFSY